MKTTLKTKHTLAVLVLLCTIMALIPLIPKSAEAATIFVTTTGRVKVTEVTLPKGSSVYLTLTNKKGDFLDGIELSTKDTKIVEVEDREFKGKKIGSTQAVLTYKNKEYTCKINVVPAYKIKVVSAKTETSKNSMTFKTTFKVKNNMKKAITFYSESAVGDWSDGSGGGFFPITLNKKTITIQPKKTVSFVATSTDGIYDGIRLRTEYNGNKFTYSLSSEKNFTRWSSPGWLDLAK